MEVLDKLNDGSICVDLFVWNFRYGQIVERNNENIKRHFLQRRNFQNVRDELLHPIWPRDHVLQSFNEKNAKLTAKCEPTRLMTGNASFSKFGGKNFTNSPLGKGVCGNMSAPIQTNTNEENSNDLQAGQMLIFSDALYHLRSVYVTGIYSLRFSVSRNARRKT